MLVTSSKNKQKVILNDIFKKVKKLTVEQKILVTDLVDLVLKVPNYHKDYSSDEIVAWFVNPILLNQYFTIYENNQLAAFLTYGYFDSKIENKWLTKSVELDIEDWTSGANLWLIDCLAPWGHAVQICNIARKHGAKHGYANKKIKFKRIYRSGKQKISSTVI